jgi:cysteinyl-tRNA synthetase
MSKSIGNMVTVEELIEQKRTAAFRLQVLQSHYRAPLTFTEEGLEAAHRGLTRIRAALDVDATASEPAPFDPHMDDETRAIFQSAMDDDFDTPTAIASVFNLARAINRSAGSVDSEEQLRTARDTLQSLLDTLGINPDCDVDSDMLDAAPFIDLLLQIREQLRAGKHWAEADAIRNGLSELGVIIADSPEGATWRKET